jgi:beta-N-acetylhexosaminidase
MIRIWPSQFFSWLFFLIFFPAACLPLKEPVATSVKGSATPALHPLPSPFLIKPMSQPISLSPTPEKHLTLEQKIGQLMIIGFDGTAASPELLEMIRKYHIGGVILFARNVESPKQVAVLTNELQKAALESGHPGLFIAIDQEGGRVARLTEPTGFSEFPSAMALAATDDPQNAYLVAAAMATEMLAVGINVDFAPDLDVNNNPANPVIGIRSFSSDPAKVAEYGLAFAKGLQDNGVLAFGKHFPGHGDTSIDSHIDLPLVPHDRARLNQIELVPFRAAIQADFAGIMSAHVTFPAIDPTPGMPATLSRPVLTGLLREELGYDGLIVTDSLEMGALAANGYPPQVGAPLALAAGADLLLFNRDHAMHRETFANLVQAVKDGKISQNQLDASVRRVLQAKQRFGLLKPATVDVETISSKTVEHLALARELAQKSITLLRDPQGLLPLKTDPAPLIVEPAIARDLTQYLGLGGSILAVETQPTNSQIDDVIQAADGRIVIVLVNDLEINTQQLKLIKELVEAGNLIIAIVHRNPFDAALLPENVTILVTYSFNPPTRDALANVLKGQAAPQGHLPVEVPGIYSIGAGLQDFQP